ncbi:MAG TPA: CheR family methyltransferase, partial [Spirochaetota bacterium]|nr:CheR family methyltransferase [Spirochaetota bacterium]
MLNNYTLSDSDFNKLREIVYKEAGIKLSDVKKVLVQSRLLKRLRELKIVSFSDYYDYLIANYETEKINFINLITTNKTDFFREKDHFEFMKDVILPDIERKNLSELRIWSAGCSSGEEPYTIAMVIKEYFKNKKSPEILILATDIDTQVLEKAKSGLYSEEHISPVEEKYIKSYFFKEVINGEIYYRIRESLKECVYFRRLNLLQEQYPMKRQFDIIF